MTYIVVGTTLTSWEDSIIDTLLEVLSLLQILPEEDHPATGTTQRLVSKKWKSDTIAQCSDRFAYVVVVTTSQ